MKRLLLVFAIAILIQLGSAKPAGNDNSQGCIMCQLVANSADQMIKSGKPIDKNEISQLCDRFGFLSSMCKDFVDAELDALVLLLNQKIDPISACEAMTYCSPFARIPILDRLNKDQASILLQKGSVLDGRLCGMCEFIVAMVQNYVQQKQNTGELEKVLDDLCDDLPSPTSSACKLLVSIYLPKIVSRIGDVTVPIEVCHQIQLCPQP